MRNGTMLQGFQWELPDDGRWWRYLTRRAFALHRLGFTAIWLPPAYKGSAGENDVGYGVYDLYDLGEFPQKGSVRTKYGTKEEYLDAVRALRAAGFQTMGDVVLNHRLGADASETVSVMEDDPEHRDVPGTKERAAQVFTRFTFPGRKGTYSGFQWDHTCFTGVDWDEAAREKGLFRIKGKEWMPDVDREKGNFDYLMGADVDMGNPEVIAELYRWGRWYADASGVDGFRLDAVKHISASFYRDWLPEMRRYTGKELYAVGEYWHCGVDPLLRYLDQVGGSMDLFDVPLHYHLHEASRRHMDLGKIFEGTLVGCRPHLAVTFVDNHDTQPGQSLESWVEPWFKPAAYGMILLRSFGYPCVFWGDLAGIPSRKIRPVGVLRLLLRLRQTHACGAEHDYFDHPQVIGFTREGTADMPGSGLAFLCSAGCSGEKRMYIGKTLAGRTMHCVLGGWPEVRIDHEGCGLFRVREDGVSLYVPRMTPAEFLLYNRKRAEDFALDSRRQALWMSAQMTKKGHKRNG